MEDSEKTVDTIFKNRFGGAANIRGIRYQILFTTLRAFDLFDERCKFSSVRPEGIEDVDLIGLYSDNEYIQVKYSKTHWNWNKLKEPLKNFIEVYNNDSNHRFVLVFNFELSKDFKRIANRQTLTSKEREKVEKKFRNLCIDCGLDKQNFNHFFNAFEIASYPEERVWLSLRKKIVNAFNLVSEATDIYIQFFISKFLKWAEDREPITIEDIKKCHLKIGEALSRENEFRAYGKGLIDKISWMPDNKADDFFEGKRTRPGHIVLGIDVKRPKWLNFIDLVLSKTRICVLRSPSGQGKSTLLFRYAFENWSAENIFILKSAESHEQVSLVRDYLKYRIGLGLPILLLIDNTGWQTRLWPYVVQECAALGIRVLITIRNEDWFRFSLQSLSRYEIIEPILEITEAKEIFNVFLSQNKIHPSIDSPEWAYEKVGKPHLLMEYVYLITHGKMLEDRLRDQVIEFSRQHEDPAKVDILRKIAVADSLGSPLIMNELFKLINLREDPQQVIKSLDGEYINVEAGSISGLHWVRSNHLLRILHESFRDPGITALEILDSIPDENIPSYISNALVRDDLNSDKFLDGIIENSKKTSLNRILLFLEGIFGAGEKIFFKTNKNMFDEAFQLLGSGGTLLLSSEFLAVGELNTINKMIDSLGDKAANFLRLKEIASKAQPVDRGLDLCKELLKEIISWIKPEMLLVNLGDTGKLLDWCSLCRISLPSWESIYNAIISSDMVFNVQVNDFCNFAQGLYRYDEEKYFKWFVREKRNILGYLKLHADCIELDVSDERVYIEFIPDLENVKNNNEDAVSRLTKLRRAIPFCKSYQSKGIWFIPFGLSPSVDDTNKNISKENLFLESDVIKNSILGRIVDENYRPDSFYMYQKAWYEIRKDILHYIKDFSTFLRGILEGRDVKLKDTIKSGRLSAKIIKNLNLFPDPPPQTPANLMKKFKSEGVREWVLSINNFFNQFFHFFDGNSSEEIKRLLVHNFKDASNRLKVMHNAFDELFEHVADYFDSKNFIPDELKRYNLMAGLLDIWLINKIDYHPPNILEYIKKEKGYKKLMIIREVKDTLFPLEKMGIKTILSGDIYYDYPQTNFTIVFTVSNPFEADNELKEIMNALVEIKNIVTCFWMVPVHQGYRYIEGGYRLFSHQLAELKDGGIKHWESNLPQEIPKEILEILPDIPVKINKRLENYSNIALVLGSISPLLEQYSKVEKLNTSENPSEIELYKLYKNRIGGMAIELGMMVAELIEKLEGDFSQMKEDKNFKYVKKFLSDLEKVLKDGNLKALMEENQFGAYDSIFNSIEQLFAGE
jgi:hypothetical protein